MLVSMGRAAQIGAACVVLLEAVGFAAGGFVLFVWLTWDAFPLVALGWLLAAGAAASPLFAGRWSAGRTGAVQILGVVTVLALNAWSAAFAVRSALRSLDERATLGTPASEAALLLALAAGAAGVVVVLLVALPASALLRRAALPAGAAAGLCCVVGVAWATQVAASANRCGDFRFDRERWRGTVTDEDDAERIADTLVDCRVLRGRTRAATEAMLGRPDRRSKRGTLFYEAGVVGDAIGFGHTLQLIVRFGRDGRVRRSVLSHDDVD